MTHSWRRCESDPAAASLLEASGLRAGDRAASHYGHFVEAASLIALVKSGVRGPECSLWGGANCSARILEASCELDFHSPASADDWPSTLTEREPVRLLFVISGSSCVLRLAGRLQLISPAALGEPAAAAAPAPPRTRLSIAIDAAHFMRLTALRGGGDVRRRRAAMGLRIEPRGDG